MFAPGWFRRVEYPGGRVRVRGCSVGMASEVFSVVFMGAVGCVAVLGVLVHHGTNGCTPIIVGARYCLCSAISSGVKISST